ncbi:hypothetical protein X271_00542 [Candidatus Hepatoplasma crinochetorum Av]|uniref:Uncharacterized protein n=1 Tax=Candidatus Hepatoplasma crinochetorum Av TaxID=1427984 RepID=W8GK67_9MOLU|nr:hypothetical protein [Candidatus Hepatoplasma crinochetorum]AHK22642.1 hypothetical protein X271_00542 [Candidatus Hepatoplasma crinochetorum Av]
MEILLFQNTKIQKNRVIRMRISNYLKSLNSFQITDTLISDLKWNSFKLIINNSEINFDYFFNNSEIIDLIQVKNYPFFNKKNLLQENLTYWNIIKINYISDNELELELEINWLQSYNLSKLIDIFTNFSVERCHINFKKQFNSDNELLYDSILQNDQPSDNFDIEKYFFNDILNSTQSQNISDGFGIQKWLLIFINKEYIENLESGDILHFKKSKRNENDTIQQIDKVYNVIFSPITSIGSKMKIFDLLGNLIAEISGKISYEWARNLPDNEILNITVVDNYPLGNIGEWSDIYGGLVFNNEDVGFVEDVNSGKALGIVLKNFKNDDDNMDKKQIIGQLKIMDSDSIINYSENNKNIGDNWDYNDEEILNFYPFKQFEISGQNENFGSGLSFSQKDLPKLKKDNIIANYFYSFSPFSWTINLKLLSSIEDKRYWLEINRDFQLWKNTDQYLKYKQNSTLNGKGDYLVPTIGLGMGALLTFFTDGIWAGAWAGLAASSALNEIDTFLNHKSIKNESNSISNSGKELENEALKGFNYTSLKLIMPNFYAIKSIAFEFHKKGIYYFNYFSNLFEILNSKKNFIYLKISKTEDIKIFNQNVFEYEKQEILKLLKKGVHFWNYYNNKIDMIFNFNYSNPDNDD